MKKILIAGLIFYLLVLIFSRFYNVAYTARFTQDESGFLVRTHQIFEEKKITLIGQVNEQGKVFGSLSVYLLLPFAAWGNFDPRAMFYGAAFWGVLTSIVIFILGYKVNPKLVVPIGLLTIFWFPLLQSGRWAWNPNFVPFWIGIGIILYLLKKPVFLFLSGIALGFAVHHHYYALFAGGFLAFMVGIQLLLKRKIFDALLIWIGYALTLLPFVVFDLRHPPGLFFRGASGQSQALGIGQNFWQDTFQVFSYFTQVEFLTWIVILLSVGLLIFDIKTRSKALFFVLPIVFHRVMLSVVSPYFFHYYLAIVPFFLVWIAWPRQAWGFITSYLIFSVLILGGVIACIPLLTQAPVIPDLPTQVTIADSIKKDIQVGDYKNVNIATLASDDHVVQSDRYRDILLGRDKIHLDSHDQYFHSDHIYVISTSDEEVIRNDAAPEITNFRSGPLVKKMPVEKTNWFVYHFSRN